MIELFLSFPMEIKVLILFPLAWILIEELKK